MLIFKASELKMRMDRVKIIYDYQIYYLKCNIVLQYCWKLAT